MQKRVLKIKNLAILGLCMAWSINLFANDTIRMVWQGTSSKGFSISATSGKTFYVDWGDSFDISFSINGIEYIRGNIYEMN